MRTARFTRLASIMPNAAPNSTWTGAPALRHPRQQRQTRRREECGRAVHREVVRVLDRRDAERHQRGRRNCRSPAEQHDAKVVRQHHCAEVEQRGTSTPNEVNVPIVVPTECDRHAPSRGTTAACRRRTVCGRRWWVEGRALAYRSRPRIVVGSRMSVATIVRKRSSGCRCCPSSQSIPWSLSTAPTSSRSASHAAWRVSRNAGLMTSVASWPSAGSRHRARLHQCSRAAADDTRGNQIDVQRVARPWAAADRRHREVRTTRNQGPSPTRERRLPRHRCRRTRPAGPAGTSRPFASRPPGTPPRAPRRPPSRS